jgi:type II secretory ATPase GspE/PulE/Tfp pilus assembly ATPase PilB-like protein
MASMRERALAYLKGEMCEDERREFEEELTRSEDLRAALESGRELLDLLAAAGEEAVVNQVNQMIQEAIRARASDIHIVGLPDEVQISFRIDGRLQEWTRFDKELQRPFVDRCKVIAVMNVGERQIPQVGRVPVRYEGVSYDVRISTMPTTLGERVTMRLLNQNNALLGLDWLGLNEGQRAAIGRILDSQRGFVLVGGFTGHGKTTLLYAMLMAINGPGRPQRSIMTIEEPTKALPLPGASQTWVNRKAGLTFATGLRSMQSCDADVAYASELRNLETAEIALEMALKGQLVLTQLHVSSAIMTIQRLREMGLENFLLSYTLRGAVGVRLVRRVCRECQEEYMPAPDDLRKAGLSPAEDGPFRRGKGCAVCRNTGYQGRLGLFEVLEVDDVVRRGIMDRAPLDKIWSDAFGRRGGSLWDDARDKVRQGLTTVEEVVWALSDYPHPRNGVDADLRFREVLDLS